MQRLEVRGAVRPIYVSLGVKRLIMQRSVRCGRNVPTDTWGPKYLNKCKISVSLRTEKDLVPAS